MRDLIADRVAICLLQLCDQLAQCHLASAIERPSVAIQIRFVKAVRVPVQLPLRLARPPERVELRPEMAGRTIGGNQAYDTRRKGRIRRNRPRGLVPYRAT